MDDNERFVTISEIPKGKKEEFELSIDAACTNFIFFVAGVIALVALCLFWGWLENLELLPYCPHKAFIILVVATIVLCVVGCRLTNKEPDDNQVEPLQREE